jgi:hypothetical protein
LLVKDNFQKIRLYHTLVLLLLNRFF